VRFAVKTLIYFIWFVFLCFVLCTHEQYELRLVAGDGRNENETVVVIHVNDKNDLPPAFNHPLYEATLEEESQGPFPINLLQVNLLFASVIVVVKSLASLIENRSDGTVRLSGASIPFD